MEELSIEEKAKLYDEAFAKAKDCQYDSLALSQPVRDVIEHIFPELKEDERIKSCIKKCLSNASEQVFDNYNVRLGDCLAWIEKQNDQEKQSKKSQESTSEEYKFKAGDWVVVDKSPLLIYDICNNTYSVKFEDGAFRNYDVRVLENKAHLWSIEKDAKVGDVLCSERDSIIIFAGVYGAYCKYHVALTVDGKLIVNENGGDHLWGLSNVACPATKEQQDLMFQKMSEKGYRWDSENKKVELLPIKEKGQLKFDTPNNKISDCASIKSRLSNVPEDLKPVADFIMRFAHWNLNKDEVSSPLAEIPLYIVLDALARREEK